ncbi:XRE family transcriptional regulator [Mycolicibacterium mengxianglii]|uniref:XRE family transcriptional regulator n=1 Tax=Mycolicibacterium mengxianglii TaxID=2736649 RepID=UPI0018D05328|nr:XRE family transcriptional regulator [Mycolicibacterium mengxianglii]
MPRTDENGRQLKALLDYLLDGDIEAKHIYDALGVSSSTYYRRVKEAEYPNAEELRLIADRFELNYPDLQVRFGLMTREEVWRYIESSPLMVTTSADANTLVDPDVALGTTVDTRTRRRLPRLSELSPRQDAPPL